jgi:TonB-dependent SusC/RagA subfamily outer membrane receptor
LRGGVAPRAYGDLLIDLAEQAAPLRLAATALSDDSSHLHQRILAMKPEVHRFALVRAGVAATFGLASLLAACATALPTDADIQKMDVSTARKALGQLELVKPTDSTVYTVDGKTVTADVAKALPSDRVAAINVTKGADGARSLIAVTTKSPDSDPGRVVISGRGGRSGGGDSASLMTTLHSAASATPLLFIDGVRSPASAIDKLDRNNIESVEVIKGVGATTLYGAEAVNGVITITTKKK